MGVKLRISVVLILLTTINSSGCTYWRHVSRPELWGMSIQEGWDYDRQRHQSNKREHVPIGPLGEARSKTDD